MANEIAPYIFGGNTGLTYAQLLERQKIAEMLANDKNPYPKNIGEGITALSRGVVEGIQARRMREMADAQAAREAYLRASGPAFGSPGQPGAPTPASAPAAGGGTSYAPGFTPRATNAPAAAAPAPMATASLNPDLGPMVQAYRASLGPRPASNPSNWNGPLGRTATVPGESLNDYAAKQPDNGGAAQVTEVPDNAGGGGDAGSGGNSGGGNSPYARARDDGRNSIAQLIADRAAAPEVPQPNPMAAGVQAPAPITASAAATIRASAPTSTTDQPLVPGSGPAIPTDIQKLPPLGPLSKPFVPNQRPEPIPMSDAQRHWFNVMNSPYINPQGATAQYAKQQYDLYEAHRKEKETQQQADFLENEKKRYEEPARTLQERNAWLQAQKLMITNPYEQRKIELELANNQAVLDQKMQELAAGKPREIKKINDQDFEWDQGLNRYVKPNVPPMDPTEIKLNEQQAKDIKYLERGIAARNQFGDLKILTTARNNALGSIPIFGNALLQDEYRAKRTAAEDWINHVLRDQSGAVLGESKGIGREGEIERAFRQYFPIYGDGPRDIAEKAERRRVAEQSFLDTLGSARPMGEKILKQDLEARKTDQPENTIQINKATGAKRISRGGVWEAM